MTEQVPSEEFYVVSVRHTQRKHEYITFWRPNSAGYAWPLSWAGKYSRDDISPGYHNNGWDTITVRCADVDAIAIAPRPKMIDNDAGPVVTNTEESWNVLLSAMMDKPEQLPKPQYQRKRRRA